MMLALPIVRQALAAGAVILVIALGLLWLRHDAAEDARNQAAAEAAVKQEEVRHEADQAARDAERDGAGRLLRDGRF